MQDPRPEDGHAENSGMPAAADPQGQAGQWQQAVSAVRAVVAWYSAGIRDLRHAVRAGADAADLDILMDARQQTLTDLQRLENGVEAEEAARLAAHYRTVLEELTRG
ncbi:hypothetical protein ABZX88_33105 [Kitasatospora aureofaciens]|uniref:hypothetical protein n=1 Tax=Kitasatospora aureofaciens TaxID=1894 RepID=UPI0033B0FD1C